MDVKELRIGNYLALPLRGYDVVTVEEILRNNFISCNVTTNEWKNTDYVPIPLTEDWLLKFGFEKKQMYSWKGNGADYQPDDSKTECRDYVLNDSFFVRFNNWGYIPKGEHFFNMDMAFEVFRSEWYEKNFENQVYFNECKYVHQLQNLYFALTGKELYGY